MPLYCFCFHWRWIGANLMTNDPISCTGEWLIVVSQLFHVSLESSSILSPGFTASRLNNQISGTWELPKHPTWCTFSILSHFSGTVEKGRRYHIFLSIFDLYIIFHVFSTLHIIHVLSERLQRWHHPPERFNMLQSMLQIGSYCPDR